MMLILTPSPTSCLDDGLQPRAVTRPRQHSHGYAISLIQLISKSTIYYPHSPCNQPPPSISFSQAMMRYGETERDQVTRKLKRCRSSQRCEITLVYNERAHTESLMRIACVCLTRSARGWRWADGYLQTNAERDWIVVRWGEEYGVLSEVLWTSSPGFIRLNAAGAGLKLMRRISFWSSRKLL